MALFGLKPGREIGILKEAVKEAILEGDIPNEYEAAKEFVLIRAEKLGLKKI
jgi:tRNA nucleotidyltransferase (CCA-adding enzyme)